jgi:hypothetical protein
MERNAPMLVPVLDCGRSMVVARRSDNNTIEGFFIMVVSLI